MQPLFTFFQSPLGITVVSATLAGIGFIIRWWLKKEVIQPQPPRPAISQQAGRDIINVEHPQANPKVTAPQNHTQIDMNEPANIEILKKVITILFIDDEYQDFPAVRILKTSGWRNTWAVDDVLVEDEKVRRADIIFVDIRGVGAKMGFANEGLGLASAIKERYPDKKVITYSAQASGNIFDPALRAVDYTLIKGADAYQFQRLVNRFAPQVLKYVLRDQGSRGEDTDF